MIKHCPNCQHDLSDNPKLAQGVKECLNCNGKYFIIETTQANHLIPIAPADKLSLLVEWLEESYKIYTGLALPFSEVRNAEHQMIKQILTKAKSLQGG